MAISVLIVDDESPVRSVLRRFLEKANCAVRDASTADEAIELMSAAPAAVLFCDVRMPVHDGFWLVDQVRKRWPETAIVMASGADDFQTILTARREGVVDYLLKPFGRESVLQALTRATQEQRS
jgi:YesN/AraC family two-component response regulator